MASRGVFTRDGARGHVARVARAGRHASAALARGRQRDRSCANRAWSDAVSWMRQVGLFRGAKSVWASTDYLLRHGEGSHRPSYAVPVAAQRLGVLPDGGLERFLTLGGLDIRARHGTSLQPGTTPRAALTTTRSRARRPARRPNDRALCCTRPFDAARGVNRVSTTEAASATGARIECGRYRMRPTARAGAPLLPPGVRTLKPAGNDSSASVRAWPTVNMPDERNSA
jgi:hypothetical protein